MRRTEQEKLGSPSTQSRDAIEDLQGRFLLLDQEDAFQFSDSGDNIQVSSSGGFGSVNIFVMLVVLGVPTVIASFFPSAFSKSLDFAGVYANCFLFGILPPIMAWVHRSRRKTRSSTDVHLLPGGNTVLLLLFTVALILGIWH